MTLIRNGIVATDQGESWRDVRFDKSIREIGASLEPLGSETVIDAMGRYILPGLIDPHLHIKLNTGIYRTPDDWTIGSRSAALGGFTTVIDFATQFPHQNFEEALAARLGEFEGHTVVDVGLHMMVTNRAKTGPYEILRDSGVRSVKVYTTYRPNYFQDDAALFDIMSASALAGLPVLIHAENDAIVSSAGGRLIEAGRTNLRYHGSARPEVAEVEAAHRAIFLAREAGALLYIVHNSSHRTVDEVARARDRGQTVWSETCPQYLTLDESRYEADDAWKFILQPPLRRPECRAGLWERVVRGHVHSIGTDHCDYSIDQKRAADDFTTTPGGLPGLETSFALMHHFGTHEGIAITDLVRLMSANPARIFELYPRKGAIAVGSDADIVIFDDKREWVVDSKKLAGTARYSPWDGLTLRGKVTDVWRRGERLVTEERWSGGSGGGEYLRYRLPREDV